MWLILDIRIITILSISLSLLLVLAPPGAEAEIIYQHHVQQIQNCGIGNTNNDDSLCLQTALQNFIPIIDQSTNNQLIDINADQMIKQIQECHVNNVIDNMIICSEDAKQEIFLHAGGSEIISADIGQSILQGNTCNINILSSCDDNGNDIVSIGIDNLGSQETSGVSNIDSIVNQAVTQENQCNIDNKICNNIGNNLDFYW